MSPKLLGGLAVAAVLAGFAAYVGLQLQRHGQACDSSLRHCPVPQADLQALAGAWCNAPAAGLMEPVRMTIALQEGRARRTETALLTGRPPATHDTRFFLENGRIIFFDHDPADGSPRGAKTLVAVAAPDRIETQALGQRVPWLRCDRLRQNGVPPAIEALYAGS